RRIGAAVVLASAMLAAAHRPAGQTPSGPPPLTLLSRDGRRTLPVITVGDQEFVALDELAAVFQLAVRDDALGALTVSYKGKTIVLTPDQALASISGKLISLPAAPVRSTAPGRPSRWLVPVDFISRALAPIYDSRLDLRKSSRLLVIGDARVPRVAVRYDLQGSGARLTIDATPRTLSTVAQDNDHLVIKFDADAVDVVLPAIQGQGLVQGVRLADPIDLVVDLGPRFASFRASSQALDVASRLTIDFVPAQTETAPAPPPPAVTPPPPPPPDLTGAPQGPAIRTMAID